LGSVKETLILIPGLMVITTPLINMRGAIAGIMVSRLSSAMHLGSFEVKYSRGTDLRENVIASIHLTVILSLVLAIFGKLICIIFGNDVMDFSNMVIISLISGIVSGLIVTLIAIIISVICYNKNLDLDIIGNPTVATIGDIITLPVLVITAILVNKLSHYISHDLIFWVGLAAVIFTIIVTIISIKNSTKLVHEILSESIFLLVPLSLFGIVACTLYTSYIEDLINVAAVLILITPFMNGCGSIGSIMTSKIGTEMHMGLVQPDFIPSKHILTHFIENYMYCIIILPFMGILSHLFAKIIGVYTPGLFTMILLALGAGIAVITIVNIIGYYTAAISYRMGYDPDNFGVPVVTSTIDLIGATAIILMLMILI
ncbi:MAG TPA: magnesium transporter, partial [Methanocorpusculum sp.]|nr:magnesium transporter [Methanocorpusculum sp.]